MRLQELRKEKGKLQTELADYLNVNHATVSAWEKEISEPNIQTLIKLADYFEVSLDYFLERTNENEITIITHNLSDEEKNLLDSYSAMDDDLKELTFAYMRHLLEANNRLKRIN